MNQRMTGREKEDEERKQDDERAMLPSLFFLFQALSFSLFFLLSSPSLSKTNNSNILKMKKKESLKDGRLNLMINIFSTNDLSSMNI
jgi:hypothetical protein